MTDTVSSPSRPLDHLVLPTENLDVAHKRLTALGFTVAHVGVHPFGTENACVYFSDGTFLEPLAIRDRHVASEAMRQGNVFVARDAVYRSQRGEEGFSALVFGTSNAEEDHAGFVEEGVSTGGILDFSRPFTDAAGKTGEASFRLAFAAHVLAPDIFFFTCQRINTPKVDRAALQSHANGVLRITGVVLSAKRPADHAGIVMIAAGASTAEPLDDRIDIALPNATVAIYGGAEMQAVFGLDEIGDAGLHARVVVFGVNDLSATETFLQENAVGFVRLQGRLVVPPATGQGATFAFEELK